MINQTTACSPTFNQPVDSKEQKSFFDGRKTTKQGSSFRCHLNYTPFSYNRLKNRTEKFLLVRTIIGVKVVTPLTLVNIMEDKRLNPEDTLRVLFLNAHNIPKHQQDAIGKLYQDDHSLVFNLQTESDNIINAFCPDPDKYSDEVLLSVINTFNNQIDNPAYTCDIIKSSIVHDLTYSCALDLDVRLLKPLEEIDKANTYLINSPYFHSNGHYLEYPADPYMFKDLVGTQWYFDAFYRGRYTKEEQMSENPDFKLNQDNKNLSFQWHSITVGKEKGVNTFNILSPADKVPLILRNEMDISEAEKLQCTRAGIYYLDEKNPKEPTGNILNDQIGRAKELIKAPQENELPDLQNIKIIETQIDLPQ